MRHAEFEECLAHEKLVEEMQKTFAEVSVPTFEYHDVRTSQMDPEEVIGMEPMQCDDSDNQGESMMSKIARASPSTLAKKAGTSERVRPSPATGMFFPQVSHAPAAKRPQAQMKKDPVVQTPRDVRMGSTPKPSVQRTPKTPAGVPTSDSPIPEPEFVGYTTWVKGAD